MSEFPGSAKVIKGAIIGVEMNNPLARLIRFQYNPRTVKRDLRPNFGGDGASVSDDGRETRGRETHEFSGPPNESISLEIFFDAADELEVSGRTAQLFGIHPQLASLEMLLYPKSESVLKSVLKLDLGVKELMQGCAPLTLFYWGLRRIQPVKITGISVEETNFDNNLNPIQATVQLQMETLTYRDFAQDQYGYKVFWAFQAAKEALATINGINNITTSLFGA